MVGVVGIWISDSRDLLDGGSRGWSMGQGKIELYKHFILDGPYLPILPCIETQQNSR